VSVNQVNLLIIFVVAAAFLFVISSILVSMLCAFWLRVESLNGNWNRARQKIKILSTSNIVAFVLIFGFLFTSFGRLKAVHSEPMSLAANKAFNIWRGNSETKELSRYAEAFTGVLAMVDLRLFRYPGTKLS
jgi:hypothetical protein